MRHAMYTLLIVASGLAVSLVSPRTGQAQADAEAQALVMFVRAREHYRGGEFERSVLLLQEAIALHDIAPLHYNLGRALQELGRWVQAGAEYERFLEMAPDTPERTRVEARLDQIRARIAEMSPPPPDANVPGSSAPEPAAPEPAAPEPPTSETTARGADPAPWIGLGVGAAVSAAGIPFAVLFDGAVGAARAAPDHRSASDAAAEAEIYGAAANTLFAVGGVVAIAALTWGLVELSLSGDEPVEVTVGPSRISLRGRF